MNDDSGNKRIKLEKDGDYKRDCGKRVKIKPDEDSLKKEDSRTRISTTSASTSRPKGSWCWLLSPDGSPLIVNSVRVKKMKTTTENIVVSGSVKKEIVKSKSKPRESKSGGWHWLLAPDGSFATAGGSNVVPKYPSNIQSKKNDQHKIRAPKQTTSWHWLLAEDGSFATAGNSPSTATRKRKRGANAVGRELPTSRTLIGKYNEKSFSSESGNDDDDSYNEDDSEDSSISSIVGEDYTIDFCTRCSSNDSRWMNMYKRLVVYRKKYKTTRVPQCWKEDPRLANWVVKQRFRCKEKHRIDLLNEIDFDWRRVGKK